MYLIKKNLHLYMCIKTVHIFHENGYYLRNQVAYIPCIETAWMFAMSLLSIQNFEIFNRALKIKIN